MYSSAPSMCDDPAELVVPADPNDAEEQVEMAVRAAKDEAKAEKAAAVASVRAEAAVAPTEQVYHQATQQFGYTARTQNSIALFLSILRSKWCQNI